MTKIAQKIACVNGPLKGVDCILWNKKDIRINNKPVFIGFFQTLFVLNLKLKISMKRKKNTFLTKKKIGKVVQ